MAPPRQPARIRSLIQRDRLLAALLPEAERLQRLNTRFALAVPAALQRSCQVIAQDGDILRVQCSHGAAAARVRSMATTLAGALSSPDRPVVGLKVLVRPDWPERTYREKTGMRPTALRAWSDLEQHLPEGGLKSAVASLLRRQRG